MMVDEQIPSAGYLENSIAHYLLWMGEYVSTL